jgi:L-lactate dehydrogenase complex protein LldG
MSRNSILSAIKANKPAHIELVDDVYCDPVQDRPLVDLFIGQAELIGATLLRVKNYDEIKAHLIANYERSAHIVTSVDALSSTFGVINPSLVPHQFADLELAVLEAQFGVAENGTVWLSEDQMGHRIVPFICQHLAVIVPINRIVKNMHRAYECIGDSSYGFGAFIGGPSKTADIEQSLVIGAHGARSMLIFLVEDLEQ